MKKLFSSLQLLQRVSLSFLLFCLLSLSFHSCSKSGSSNSKIDPSNTAKLGDALTNSFPTGSKKTSGSLPSPSESANAPKITTGGTSSSNVVSGDKANISFAITPGSGGSTLRESSASQYAGGCYVSLPGYSSYWNVPAPSTTTTNWTLPVTIPSNVGSGSFSLQVCVYTTSGLISNIINWTVTVTGSSSGGSGGGGGTPGTGSARITVNGTTKNSIACVFSTTPPTGGGDEYDGCFTNVISIPLNTSSGEGLYLYNVPTGSSATASISNWCTSIDNATGTSSCASTLFAIYVDNDGAYSSAVSISGTFKKTGANSFTISNLVVRDYNESDVTYDDDCGYSGTTYNISGSGTYASYTY